MEQCESLDAEMTELQEFQSEASDVISQDDEDEVEELQNSLREVVQDMSVKPKLQCLMVDPSFSMVTVQSEDSGIVWETASSRCSTPWASETSSISEACSTEGSGTAGKITIVFDEENIIRRRTRSGGRRSRLGDRLSRPGSSRSASALGVERPEMAEVSLPNVKQEETKTEAELEEIKNKDQQLFSLISEGYEILNIRVPSKLPTVDEEESTELQDNLSYLDQTPEIRSRNHLNWKQQNDEHADEMEVLNCNEPSKQDSSQSSAITQSQENGSSDIDYFEKFTLVDEVVPGEQAPELQQEVEHPAAEPQAEPTSANETAEVSPQALEDSFVFVTDVEIAGEHLDEVFYGDGSTVDAMQRRADKGGEDGGGTRTRRESQRKESGSVLFGSEETTLTPIYISSGPPKIIDPILLEEPTAMSFMYSDLYEDAVGERRKSDEEYSEAESVASEKSFKRCVSDSEEADGYLEKFTLKDETPIVELQAESTQDKRKGRMMWSQSEFETTGCLARVLEEEDKDKMKEGETISQEVGAAEMNDAAMFEETEKDREGIQLSAVTEQAISQEPIQEIKAMEEGMQDQEEKHEVKGVQDEPPEIITDIITDVPLPENQQLDIKVEKAEEREEQQREKPVGKVSKPGIIKTEQPCQIHEGGTAQVPVEALEETSVEAHVGSEMPQTVIQSEKQTENPKNSLSEEAATDTEMVATDEKEALAARADTLTEVKDFETVKQVMLSSSEPSIEMEKSAEASLSKEEEVVPEEAAPVEVLTDCETAVHAVVKVTEKTVDEEEIQTKVQIDLQDVPSVDTTAVPGGEKRLDVSPENNVIESPRFVSEAGQESEIKTKHSSKVLLMHDKVMTDPGQKEHEIIGSNQHKHHSILTAGAKTKTPTEDSGVQETAGVEDEVILLVPKGQAVEMDINIGQRSENTKTVSPPEPDNRCEYLIVSDNTTISSKAPRAPVEDTITEQEAETEGVSKDEASTRNKLVRKFSPVPCEEEAKTEGQRTEEDLTEDEGILSPLRSFTPQEDLPALHREEIDTTEVEQTLEMKKVAGAPETDIKEDVGQDIDLHREDAVQTTEGEAVEEGPEATAEEYDYEIISKQDITESSEPEILGDAEEPGHDSSLEREESLERMKVSDVFADEELVEADYEIIDAEEESQARLASELQGMDWFCLTCERLLPQEDFVSGEHHGHEVAAVDKAFDEIKDRLSDWISELQGRSENIEDLVSELELSYNSVEDQFVESEVAMRARNEEMMALVMEQYNNMSVSMEEEKKAKLEQLYDQIVSFQENIDAAKATLETTVREAETDARSPEDIHASLKAALESTMSLELGSKGLLVFEDYAKGNTSSSHLAQRKGIPVPQRPKLQLQEPGSATSTNVTVYWKVNPGDIIDCFQVYCMEDPQGAVSEEYRVTVKESYCVLEELEPDKTYKVWVMAVNYTGCSLPSERLAFRTASSVPVIDTERCTVMWDSAMLRWSPGKQIPGQSYTLEYCRQYELEGDGLRSISGIKSCEQRVLLQPNENYLFYIKTVTEAGASDQSEAALISTKGTRFHLLKASAHPALELSADQTTLYYSQDAYKQAAEPCPSILGELLPGRGHYYWETIVSGCAAYRLGVTYSTASKNSSLGEDNHSWCLQCIPSPSGCRYKLLHNGIRSSVFMMDLPERVGTLLDYQLGRLCFYNAQSGQLLGAFRQHFTQFCRPALALEVPGSLQVSMVLEVPEFAKNS